MTDKGRLGYEEGLGMLTEDCLHLWSLLIFLGQIITFRNHHPFRLTGQGINAINLSKILIIIT